MLCLADVVLQIVAVGIIQSQQVFWVCSIVHQIATFLILLIIRLIGCPDIDVDGFARAMPNVGAIITQSIARGPVQQVIGKNLHETLYTIVFLDGLEGHQT